QSVLATFVRGRRQLRDRQHRQRLYPVVDALGLLKGVITRRDVLDQALRDDGSEVSIDAMLVTTPAVAYPDETLRAAAYRMAATGPTRLPVIERGTRRVVGLLTLSQLLQGRLRDLQEARDAEQVLRIRLVVPTILPARRNGVLLHARPEKSSRS